MLTLTKWVRISCTALLAISGGVLIAGGVELIEITNVLEIVSGVVALVAALFKQLSK